MVRSAPLRTPQGHTQCTGLHTPCTRLPHLQSREHSVPHCTSHCELRAPCVSHRYVDTVEAAIGCDSHKHDAVHVVHTVLFACSVAILSTFQIELLSLLAALGPVFFRNPLYVLDLFVVTTSLTLEVF